MENTERRELARSAIQELANEFNLPTELDVLSERWNTVARLGSSGIIAKAATLADLVLDNPQWSFMIEVEVCRYLSTRHAPVQHPFGEGFYTVSGLPITLWHEIDGEVGEASGENLVRSLAEVHRIGDDLLDEQPWFATITRHFQDVFPKLRDRKVIDSPTLGSLEDYYHRLIEQVSSADITNGFIHGDAQRKNALAIGSGAVWIDLEECSFGPIAWDLACLTMHRRFDTDRVLDLYAEISGLNRFRNDDIDTLKQLRDLEGLTWMLAIQHEREPSFTDEAALLLSDVLNYANAD